MYAIRSYYARWWPGVIDEGYTKYHCDWRHRPPLPAGTIRDLNAWRNRLWDAGLVGYDGSEQVGYGNVSVRLPGDENFVISGTQTGHIRRTDRRHYCTVTGYDT